MTLILDSRKPVLWRTPHSLQVGLDEPAVVLNDVTPAEERMLAGLAKGLTREGLRLVGAESGLSPEQVEDFASRVRPALAVENASPHACVEIDGHGLTADRLERNLHECGFETRRAISNDPAPRETHSTQTGLFAVVIGDFVLDPERRGRWLRRDIPHLPLVYGDSSVTIGPFIEPGSGPCLYCLELHRRDADAAWPAMASQLLGKISAAQTPFIASEAATIAARMIRRRGIEGGGEAMSLTLDCESGARTERSWQAHPECACAGLSVVSGAGDRENGTGNSPRAAGRWRPPRTNEAVSVPA